MTTEVEVSESLTDKFNAERVRHERAWRESFRHDTLMRRLCESFIRITNPKYQLDKSDTITNEDGETLYRVVALRDTKHAKAGEKGGYIESERNLSHAWDAWVGRDAQVSGNAFVWDRAVVSDNAVVKGNANIAWKSYVGGHAKIEGDAVISGTVTGNAHIQDDVTVVGTVTGNAHLSGNARVVGKKTVVDYDMSGNDVSTQFEAGPGDDEHVYTRIRPGPMPRFRLG